MIKGFIKFTFEVIFFPITFFIWIMKLLWHFLAFIALPLGFFLALLGINPWGRD